MTKALLYNEYIELHPDFLIKLNSIREPNIGKLKRKLEREKQKTNFLSLVSEVSFALFLEGEKIEYEYEPKIGNKNPDFKINSNTLNAIYFDVKRFNIPEKDQVNNKCLYDLGIKINSIKRNYYVRIEQVVEFINIDVDKAFQEISVWLDVPDRNLNDYINYENSVIVTIAKRDTSINKILNINSAPIPKINFTKIKSDIIAKIRSYQEQIINKSFPFFVAVDLTFDTLLDPEDYFLFFHGIDYNSGNSSKSNLSGEFNADKELNGICGILIKYNGKFYWVNNPTNNFQLSFQNALLSYR